MSCRFAKALVPPQHKTRMKYFPLQETSYLQYLYTYRDDRVSRHIRFKVLLR